MAITGVDYLVIRALRDGGFFRLGGDLLEIGESCWYNDVHPAAILPDAEKYGPAEHLREARNTVTEAGEDGLFKTYTQVRRMARVFWTTFLQPRTITAVDINTDAETDLHHDLNHPISLVQYDTVMNLGTAEHIFNVAQVFKTVHDCCRPGGIMYHQAPFKGWVDHGFFNFQPTLYFDLAEANGYDGTCICYGDLHPPKATQIVSRSDVGRLVKEDVFKEGSILVAALRKGPVERPFAYPRQGAYNGHGTEDWLNLR